MRLMVYRYRWVWACVNMYAHMDSMTCVLLCTPSNTVEIFHALVNSPNNRWGACILDGIHVCVLWILENSWNCSLSSLNTNMLCLSNEPLDCWEILWLTSAPPVRLTPALTVVLASFLHKKHEKVWEESYRNHEHTKYGHTALFVSPSSSLFFFSINISKEYTPPQDPDPSITRSRSICI